ncbi:ThiF family adenylyltransferase [Pseudolabrys taiwanensis]|uniref:ThiF family adenylyltransferase n=1 Tax=Pseudolabrys taiwanensis TaxID=331696 RepID=A0A345ZX92_9HYPH|nr:ThiF family adenylyltransferase [Pseudolabrys taiwanensis]AXK81539.1 ThiF family adenylyltransferase [Pseudolabrys taiwanensis]
MSRLDRQSFLGPESDAILGAATIGIVGLGGGGSHIAQQAAHMGIGGYVNADPDIIEDTNTNRLIGGTLADVDDKLPKVDIAQRLIRGLQPDARIVSAPADWHGSTDDLKLCDVIVGAVDSFKEREQLERFARRHLIPYIDIGMDVHEIGKKAYLVSGQVILSMPGCPCLRCCGFITDERLEQEAQHYGAAGSRPQVVWSNGVLASTAVGLLTQLLTPWFANPPRFVYLDYDGNKGTITRNPRMELLKNHICPHHPADETGDPLFDIRRQTFAPRAAPAAPARPVPWWRALLRRIKDAL